MAVGSRWVGGRAARRCCPGDRVRRRRKRAEARPDRGSRRRWTTRAGSDEDDRPSGGRHPRRREAWRTGGPGPGETQAPSRGSAAPCASPSAGGACPPPSSGCCRRAVKCVCERTSADRDYPRLHRDRDDTRTIDGDRTGAGDPGRNYANDDPFATIRGWRWLLERRRVELFHQRYKRLRAHRRIGSGQLTRRLIDRRTTSGCSPRPSTTSATT